MIPDEVKNKLVKEAELVSKNSYSPYSKFAVGSAVLCDDGTIFTGCNVENASYGLTICAERNAIGSMISSGKKNIQAIAIYSPFGDITPCGACRQFINEFGDEIPVIFQNQGKLIEMKSIELLPGSFKKTDLKY